ncbi:NTP transferase domain-containing protein [Nocardiopsis sp. NPDC006198]|uniref:molybdenum cofactor guanylyltransferase n=1 Tax=Nocardiopsis sp. NPDC006198 TaxID=3154472 RepID=UPI0033A9870C
MDTPSTRSTPPRQDRPGALDAVILAGGGGRRMGGVDKPGLAVAGRTLLERVADAVRSHGAAAAGTGADTRLVVVGPRRESPRALYVREDPPGSGPVPALRAGIAHVRSGWFALLAADLPHLAPEHLDALAGAVVRGGAGAVFVDPAGREQWLTGVWRTDAVRDALAGYTGRSLYGLLGPLEPRPVPADDLAAADCDTPEDLARARRLLEPPAP